MSNIDKIFGKKKYCTSREKSIESFLANRDLKAIEEEMNDAQISEMNNQLAIIATQLNNMVLKQTEHDQVLKYLSERVEEPTPVHIENVKDNRNQAVDLFRIPDPIKSIPSFDGNKKQVAAWLKTAEETLRMFEPLVPQPQLRMYIQAVKNKIEGKARDIICLAGDPESFQEIKQILLEALGDKQELTYYKSQLWANKQNDSMTIHNFYHKTKEIVQNIKTLAKQNEIYNNSWQAICSFIEEDALAAFISGLQKPYFGYAQAAKPKNIEEAYAFLCKFSSNETISNNSKKSNQFQNPQKWNQGNSAQSKFNHYQNKPNQFNTSNYKKPNGPNPEPMDVDASMRTRNSFVRKVVNNHEILQENCPEIEISNRENLCENDNLEEQNFQVDPGSDTED